MANLEPGDREEMLLQGILDGETETNIEPGTRKERLLKAILENGGGGGSALPPYPVNDGAYFLSLKIQNGIETLSWSPNGYEMGNYLEADSTNQGFILLEHSFTEINGFKVEAQYTGTPVSDTWFFGAWVSHQDTMIGFHSGTIKSYIGGGSAYEIPFDNQKHVFVASPSQFAIDGNVMTDSPRWNNVPSKQIGVIGDNSSHAPTKNVRVYPIELYSDNILVARYVPAKQTVTGVIGLYDEIGKYFCAATSQVGITMG
ncbi:MAG: hypothetical protein IJS78_06475 [Clostridia bacterium]|nr:hypothetical protein [Clostridia bacterium]